MQSTQKISIYPFLIIGFVTGTLLALLATHISQFAYGVVPNTKQYAFMHILFYCWIGSYGYMFLLAYPDAQSLKRLIFITLIPSFISSLPNYWESYHTFAQMALMFSSAYALNVFHMHYQKQGFQFSYQTLFYAVWDSFVKMFIAFCFSILCWIILFLASELFSLTGVVFLKNLIRHSWFAILSTSVFTSIGLYIATKTNNVVRNTRIVLITICRYLLIPLAIVSILFVIFAIVLAYQHHLHFTRQYIFSSIALLSVLFINGVYQEGSIEQPYPIFLLWICRVFLWITPIFPLLALYAAYYHSDNNIMSNGFNTNNTPFIINAVILLVYTLCYAVIAIRRQKPWLKSIERVNVALGIFLIFATLVTTYPAFVKHFPQPKPRHFIAH